MNIYEQIIDDLSSGCDGCGHRHLILKNHLEQIIFDRGHMSTEEWQGTGILEWNEIWMDVGLTKSLQEVYQDGKTKGKIHSTSGIVGSDKLKEEVVLKLPQSKLFDMLFKLLPQTLEEGPCEKLCHPDDTDCKCKCEDCHAWNRSPLPNNPPFNGNTA